MIPKLIYFMYLSSINEKINENIDGIIKWFLYSNKNEFEKVKSKISIDRLKYRELRIKRYQETPKNIKI